MSCMLRKLNGEGGHELDNEWVRLVIREIDRCELPSTRYLQRCLHRTRGEFVSIAIFYQKSVVLFWATLSLMQNRLRTEEFVKKI